MKSLAFVSVVVILLAGLLVHPAAPKAPAQAEPQRAEWRDAQTKHWRGIILRKN